MISSAYSIDCDKELKYKSNLYSIDSANANVQIVNSVPENLERQRPKDSLLDLNYLDEFVLKSESLESVNENKNKKSSLSKGLVDEAYGSITSSCYTLAMSDYENGLKKLDKNYFVNNLPLLESRSCLNLSNPTADFMSFRKSVSQSSQVNIPCNRISDNSSLNKDLSLSKRSSLDSQTIPIEFDLSDNSTSKHDNRNEFSSSSPESSATIISVKIPKSEITQAHSIPNKFKFFDSSEQESLCKRAEYKSSLADLKSESKYLSATELVDKAIKSITSSLLDDVEEYKRTKYLNSSIECYSASNSFKQVLKKQNFDESYEDLFVRPGYRSNFDEDEISFEKIENIKENLDIEQMIELEEAANVMFLLNNENSIKKESVCLLDIEILNEFESSKAVKMEISTVLNYEFMVQNSASVTTSKVFESKVSSESYEEMENEDSFEEEFRINDSFSLELEEVIGEEFEMTDIVNIEISKVFESKVHSETYFEMNNELAKEDSFGFENITNIESVLMADYEFVMENLVKEQNIVIYESKVADESILDMNNEIASLNEIEIYHELKIESNLVLEDELKADEYVNVQNEKVYDCKVYVEGQEEMNNETTTEKEGFGMENITKIEKCSVVGDELVAEPNIYTVKIYESKVYTENQLDMDNELTDEDSFGMDKVTSIENISIIEDELVTADTQSQTITILETTNGDKTSNSVDFGFLYDKKDDFDLEKELLENDEKYTYKLKLQDYNESSISYELHQDSYSGNNYGYSSYKTKTEKESQTKLAEENFAKSSLSKSSISSMSFFDNEFFAFFNKKNLSELAYEAKPSNYYDETNENSNNIILRNKSSSSRLNRNNQDRFTCQTLGTDFSNMSMESLVSRYHVINDMSGEIPRSQTTDDINKLDSYEDDYLNSAYKKTNKRPKSMVESPKFSKIDDDDDVEGSKSFYFNDLSASRKEDSKRNSELSENNEIINSTSSLARSSKIENAFNLDNKFRTLSEMEIQEQINLAQRPKTPYFYNEALEKCVYFDNNSTSSISEYEEQNLNYIRTELSLSKSHSLFEDGLSEKSVSSSEDNPQINYINCESTDLAYSSGFHSYSSSFSGSQRNLFASYLKRETNLETIPAMSNRNSLVSAEELLKNIGLETSSKENVKNETSDLSPNISIGPAYEEAQNLEIVISTSRNFSFNFISGFNSAQNSNSETKSNYKTKTLFIPRAELQKRFESKSRNNESKLESLLNNNKEDKSSQLENCSQHRKCLILVSEKIKKAISISYLVLSGISDELGSVNSLKHPSDTRNNTEIVSISEKLRKKNLKFYSKLFDLSNQISLIESTPDSSVSEKDKNGYFEKTVLAMTEKLKKTNIKYNTILTEIENELISINDSCYRQIASEQASNNANQRAAFSYSKFLADISAKLKKSNLMSHLILVDLANEMNSINNMSRVGVEAKIRIKTETTTSANQNKTKNGWSNV